MIARILLALSLALLVAAPGRVQAGAAQIELLDEGAPFADDEALVPCAPADAPVPPSVVRPPPPGERAPTPPALARIFRPPRPALA